MSRLGHCCLPWLLLVAVGLTGGCGEHRTPPVAVPEPDTNAMEPMVEQRLADARSAVLADAQSAAAWGRFGRVAHAHELWDEAAAAYREAEKLDVSDERWPYFLGDVLSVVGTDLDGSAAAFRRAMVLLPDYPPAHMRLGKVLVAAGLDVEAAIELARALALEPELQPARVALAQLRLAAGDFEDAAALLEAALEREPRHAQALSTLSQVYMRLGRRDSAREVAARVSEAGSYNLYADQLMGEVVAEGVSSAALWSRARAFLDDGNYQQAAVGLARVVELLPDNAAVHHQLGFAYGNLGRLELARRHLEQAVALAEDGVESRVQLATLCIDQGDFQAALPLLREVLELAPEHAEAGWLLGRALLRSGAVGDALSAFEQAGEPGSGEPAWAQNEWGNALAQSGRPQEALLRFQAALEADAEDAQAHFFVGLVLEGLGRTGEAVTSYCHSLAVESNPPAEARLRALAESCG